MCACALHVDRARGVCKQAVKLRVRFVCDMADKRGLKRKHSATSFQREWSKVWPCIQPLEEHPEKVFCTVCSSSFAIVHQGKRDVERHIQGVEYLESDWSLLSIPAINNVLSP